MTITPAIAFAPYIDVADPSLSILMLSMSSELRPAIAELIIVTASPDDSSSVLTSVTSSMMTPSTTHRGLEFPRMEVAPRTLIFGAVPKVEDTFWTETPAARPSSDRLISATPLNIISSASSLLDAPVKRRLSMSFIPVETTAASRASESGTSSTLTTGATRTSCI